MSKAIEKYKDIMNRYRSGEFGENHLSLYQILEAAGVPGLLNEMTFDELSDLLLETRNVSFKVAIAQVRDMKG